MLRQLYDDKTNKRKKRETLSFHNNPTRRISPLTLLLRPLFFKLGVRENYTDKLRVNDIHNYTVFVYSKPP